MTEKGGTKPDYSRYDWATGPLAETVTEPSAGSKQTGFAYTDPVPHDELNWRWQFGHELFDYLQTVVPREFTTLTEAIAAVSLGDIFRVSGGDPLKYLWETDWSVLGSSGAYIIRDIACDGQRVYYVQDDGVSSGLRDAVYAADPEDGSDVWVSPISPPSIATHLKIASDGLYVYTIRTTAVGVGASANAYDPSDGSHVRGLFGGYTGGTFAIDANGVYCAIVGNAGVDIQSCLVATGAISGSTWTRGAIANAIALSRDAIIVGGTRSTTDVDARSVSNPSGSLWGITLPTTGAPTVNAIAVDQERVYVATDRIALSAGGNANLFVLSLNPPTTSGLLLYTVDVTDGSAVNLDYITCDDRYVYPSEDSSKAFVIDKRNGDQIDVLSGWVVFCCDGVSIYLRDEAGSKDDLARKYRGGPTRTFQRVDGDDPARYPFYNLAIPTLE